MVLHAYYLLRFSFEFDGLATLGFASGAGLFVGLMYVILARVFLQ